MSGFLPNFLYSREIYRSGQEQFSSAQRAQRKFRMESRRSVKPISFDLLACFLGHYRMARMSQSASPCGLASWMSPQMIPDTHLLKLLFLARYYLSLDLLAFLSISVVLRTCFLDLHCCNILLRRTCFPSFP